MTRSVEIPEEAAQAAAAELYGAIGGSGVIRWSDVDHPAVRKHYVELAGLIVAAALPYLAPAGDGGLREALEKLADRIEGEGGIVRRDLANEIRILLPPHSAAPAVPQPVDREALSMVIWRAMPGNVSMRDSQAAADAVLALLGGSVLAGEQEQVAPE